MRESFEIRRYDHGEYRCGLYATYAGKDMKLFTWDMAGFILVFHNCADENFTFPTDDGRYLLQTDMRGSTADKSQRDTYGRNGVRIVLKML